MNESKFNFAFVFSMVVLLVFAYITFLGLAYWTGGSLTTPIILTLAIIVLVAACVYIMSMSKSTRWTDIGLAGQICFGVIVLAVLLCSSIPFTNFLRVAGEKRQLSELMTQAVESAENLDSAYHGYAEARIAAYRNNLTAIAMAKSTNPAKYAQAFGQASGATDADKINVLTASLSDKLLPSDAGEIVNERHEWIDRAANLNVWNPMTASNINTMKDQMQLWTQNYVTLSEVAYAGENPSKFEYNQFDNKLADLTESYQKFRRPSAPAIIISLVCFAIMLLPYFLAQGSLAASKSGKENSSIFE